jgi:endonuclease-3
MTKANKERILAFLDKEYSDAKGELEYTKDYELLIAVVLSAQSTDVAVNNVTRKLFAKYPTFESLLNVKEAQFAAYFKTLGLYRNKAKHVYNLIHLLNEHHNGVVPSVRDDTICTKLITTICYIDKSFMRGNALHRDVFIDIGIITRHIHYFFIFRYS